MHEINCSLILSNLRKTPSQTRAKLAKQTGLTRSTISNLTDGLIEKNFIHEVGYEPSSGGRRGILLELNPNGGAAIALKINASSVQCALSNFIGEIQWHKLVPLDSTDVDTVLPVAEGLIEEAIQQNTDDIPIIGIGVGSTGLISDRGDVIYSKFLDWNHVSFRKRWEKRFNLPVTVDNEVSLAAFGENHYGSSTNESHFIYVEIGYGLGAGIVIDGSLYQGRNGYAGEVGYLMSHQVAGDGSLETVSLQSITNIPYLIQTTRQLIEEKPDTELDAKSLNFDKIVSAAQNGDDVANQAFTLLSRNVGMGIASLINIFDITTFLLGGELGQAYEPYLDIIYDEICEHVVVKSLDNIQVKVSNLKPDATLMGAVAQVFDDIFIVSELNV